MFSFFMKLNGSSFPRKARMANIVLQPIGFCGEASFRLVAGIITALVNFCG